MYRVGEVWLCYFLSFSRPLGVVGWLRLVIVALPGIFIWRFTDILFANSWNDNGRDWKRWKKHNFTNNRWINLLKCVSLEKSETKFILKCSKTRSCWSAENLQKCLRMFFKLQANNFLNNNIKLMLHWSFQFNFYKYVDIYMIRWILQ